MFNRSGRGSTRTSPFSRVRERYGELDRASLAIALAGLAIVAAIIFPRLVPAYRQGPACTDLTSPLGGNNRSVLAESGSDPQDLDLELELVNDRVTVNEPLRVNLRFVNNDIGPVILYLESGLPPFTTVDSTTGLRFEIRGVGAGEQAAIDNQTGPSPPAGWPAIDPDRLHLLGSRARCTQTYDFPVTQLTPGDYRIQAFYFNNNPGVWQSNVLPGDDLTPTPAYTDQGVWTRPSPISSEEIRFSIVSGP